jgi:hypothetical protein
LAASGLGRSAGTPRLERRAIWTAPLPGFAARLVHFSAAESSVDPEPRPFGY